MQPPAIVYCVANFSWVICDEPRLLRRSRTQGAAFPGARRTCVQQGDTIMSKSESEQNLLKMKAAEAQATAARLAKVVQTHAELLAAHKKDGSLDDSSQWPAVWAGAIASGFGHYAFTTDWTGGAPHPFWTAGAHPTGGDWTAWATGTWAGAGQFYGDPKIYYGKQVWANLTCGGVRRRRSQFIPVQQRRRTTDRQIWGYFSGIGGCNISCQLTYTAGP